ncbi:MAG TPA: adenylate/guanylate cyclase domain-containing protein [Bacteroidota bacterium]|nr:adenylate/guanylate cyclase domain-containing protein [Bacteroidota bacterium]
MSIPPRRKYLIRTAAGFMLACIILASLYPVLIESKDPESILIHSVVNGSAAGFLIGLCITIAELAWFQGQGKKMRFLPYLLMQTFFYVVVINIWVVGVSILHQVLIDGIRMDDVLASESIRDLMYGRAFLKVNAYALVMIFFVNFVRQVNRMLGQNALMNFLTGKYHKPVEEERVFMFLDLKASTPIAEKLGHKKYHEFLNDFFFDITPAIVESRGEIYQYVGDEIVVTWSKRGDTVPADSIYCYFRIAAAVARTSDRYEREYGFIPEFKAGFHYGPVVTGFIGDVKRDVVFHGDTVNTASRIRTECTTVNKNLLLSGDLLRNITLSSSLTPERMGRIRLKGKEKEIELFTLAEAS